MNNERLEASYLLSPMQQGMLLHTIHDRHSGAYIQQIVCELREGLRVPLLIKAWKQAVERHAVLRTSFQWEALAAPIQEVSTGVELPFETVDLTNLSSGLQQQRIDHYLQADRYRGFDLTRAPLLRVALFKFADDDYRLIWTFHHALLDGRSHFFILKEVFDSYDAYCRGAEQELKPPHAYSEYIGWLQEQDLAKAESFWRQSLRGFTTPIALRLPVPPREAHDRPHATEVIRLSDSVLTKLRLLATKNDVTLNNLIQAAWALLLKRYSGEQDILFGVTRACRHWVTDSADSRVGLFINTIPFRVRVDPEQNLLSWLKELRAQHLSLREYEHTPLMKIQQWSDVPPGTSLFESVLVFEGYEMNERLRTPGQQWTARNFTLLEQTNYPLTLAVYASSDLVLKLEYDEHRFERSSIEGILSHLKTLLEGIAADPYRRNREFSLLTDKERRQLLVDWNQTTKEPCDFRCIHQLFESQAATRPDAVALAFDDRRLTYRELNEKANQLARYLQKRGVGPDVLVGMCVERSVDMVIGLLGILKAGGAYLPLDPLSPDERLDFMIEDAATSVLLTQEAFRSRFAGKQGIDTIYLDAEPLEMAGENTENIANVADPENLAYVIYTSGSSGKPKGVLVTHYNVIRLFASTDELFRFNCDDVSALFHSYAFDFSVWEIWGALLYGGRLVIVPYWISRAPEEFHRLLCEEEVTILNQTPPAFRQLIQADTAPNGSVKLALRLIIFGGEALNLNSLKPWFDRHPDQQPQLVNMYGITETTVHVTYRPLSARDLEESSRSPIGRPLRDLQVYVLDREQRPVPIGVPGELYVGGAGLSRGYLNRPDLTADRFVPHPFSDKPGAKLYRTGDLGRRQAGGDIEYLGRSDRQVKIRGFRVELGEIESVLNDHERISDCTVMVRDDQPEGNNLVAYVVVAKDGPEASDLQALLREKLPDYMVPAAFVYLDQLPLTPNGKVNRRGLPPPSRYGSASQESFIAPNGPTEVALANVWSEILKIERIGAGDNFFDLGGNSLLATQVMSRVRDLFQLELPIRSLFESPKLKELSSLIDMIKQDASNVQAPAMAALPRTSRPVAPTSEVPSPTRDELRTK